MGLSTKLLDSRDLPEIYKEINIQGLTGVLFAERLKYKRSVYFQNGNPIFATSNLSEDKIGKILFNQSKISMDQLMQALDKAKNERKRLGSVLVELGHISAKDLFEAVVFQVEQIIYSLFEADWRDAKLTFDPNAAFGDEVIKLSIQPADVVLGGIRRSYNPDLIALNVGDVTGVFRPTGKRPFEIEKLKISPEEKQAFRLLDGTATLDEIIRASGVPKAKVLSLIYALKALDIIEPLRAAEAKKTPVKVPAPAVELDPIADEGEDLILGDDDLPADLIEDVETVPAAKVVPQTASPAAKKPAAAGKIGSEEELKSEAVRLRQLNYYERMGVSPKATAAEIVAAYATLRRKFDSDLPETLRAAGKAPFGLIFEAYRALSLEGNRQIYDELLATGGTLQEIEHRYRMRMAANRFEDGKRAWDEKELEDAEAAFRESISLDPAKADYYFALGLVLSARGVGAPNYADIEALFSKAAALQPDRPRGYYYLGTIFKHRGDTKKAIDAYRRALSLDARYEPAREGLAACGQSA